MYLPNAYAVEFLRHNLAPERLRWFRDELAAHGLRSDDRARWRNSVEPLPFRFSAFEEKVLWGDLADLFHLAYAVLPRDDPIRKTLADSHFDGVYLGEPPNGFHQRRLPLPDAGNLEVKYLQMPRFREVISSIPLEIRLSHFLNDGDSPDIPIPIYVDYLNQIRDLARRTNVGASVPLVRSVQWTPESAVHSRPILRSIITVAKVLVH